MTDKQKEKLPEDIKNNPELKNTINVNGAEYNISAVTAEVAKQTQAGLKLKPSLIDGSANETESGIFDGETESGIFDGEEDKIIKYVPYTGGKFIGPVHLNNGYNVEDLIATELPEAILNLEQIENKLNNLTGAPCWKWDGEALTAVEQAGVYQKINIIVGKADDFDLEKIRTAVKTDAPCLYICKDGEPDKTKPVSNKILLCLPNADPVEISKGADRLNSSADDAITSDYYTYETLAAIIAGINSRLAALGGSDKYALELPTVLPETKHVVIPDTIISDKILEVPENIPSVQDLEEDIDNLKIELLDGVAGNYATKTVGGISAGSQINKDITVSGLLKTILGIKDGVAPSGFTFTISPSSITADLDQTAQSITATWLVSNSGTYTGNYTPTIGGVTGAAAGKSGGTIDITVTFTGADTSKSISGSATYAAGTGFNAGTLNGSSKSLTINRTCYYGPSSGTLSSTARTSKNSWTINQNTALENDYFVIQYPKAWGTLSSITDNDTGYEAVANSETFNKTPTEVTKNGGTYYQYRTNNKLSSKLSFTINS